MRPDRVVRLRDGREVSSSSEEWRAECEARYVAKLPDREARRGYLSRVEAKRGADARKALERAAREIFDAEVAPVLRAALAAKRKGMEATAHEFDLDALRATAQTAARLLAERSAAQAAGQPFDASLLDKATADFVSVCSPALVLLALQRLDRAMALLEVAHRGSDEDRAKIKDMVDAFLSGVVSLRDLAHAWPHYADQLLAAAKQAEAEQEAGGRA